MKGTEGWNVPLPNEQAENKRLASYHRQIEPSRSLAPLGFLAWLKPLFGTLSTWHLSFAISLIAFTVFADPKHSSQNLVNGLDRMLLFLAAGPFIFPQYLPALLIIFLASVAGSRMRPSWLPLLAAAMGLGTATTMGIATLAQSVPYSLALPNLAAVSIGAAVGSAVFTFLNHRLRGQPTDEEGLSFMNRTQAMNSGRQSAEIQAEPMLKHAGQLH